MQKNGIAINDAAGKARPLKDVFIDVAKLASQANNEIDKMEFAKKVGIGADGVEFMERYIKAIKNGNAALTEGEQRIIEYKRKAAEFDKAWQEIWDNFKRNVKSAMYDGIIAVIDFTKASYDAVVGAYTRIKNITIDVAANIVGAFQGAKAAIIAAWQNLPATFEYLGKSIYNAFVGAIQDALNAVIGLINRAADFIRQIPSMLSNVWKSIVDSVTNFVNQAVSGIVEYISKIPQILSEMAAQIANLFQSLLQMVSDVWSNLPAIFENFAKMAVNKLIEIVQGGINAIISGFNAVLNLVNGGSLSKLDLSSAKLQMSSDAQDMGRKVTDAYVKGLNEGKDKVKKAFDTTLSPQLTNAKVDSISMNASKTIQGLYDKKDGTGGAKEGLDMIQRYIEQLRLATAEAKLEIQYFGKGNEEKLVAINLEKLATTAKKAGREATDEEKKAVVDTTKEYVNQIKILEQLKSFKEASSALANSFADAIDSWVVKGKKFNDVIKDLLKSLASMALKGFLTGSGPFAGTMGTSNNGGLFGSIFGSLISGFRASGGPVDRNKAYVVGEKGPELFVPGVNGGIVSNDNLNSSKGENNQSRNQTIINIDARGAEASAVARIERAVASLDSTFNSRVIRVQNTMSQRKTGF